MSVTGQAIAEKAITGGYVGIPYSKLDCQAFVERVLHDVGLPIINYRGSNHQWRELVYDRVRIDDARRENDLLPGMLVFTVKYDGGETKRGYHDDMGNAVHVGIYVGEDNVIHSTTGGVQWGKLSRFTHAAKIIDVDYQTDVELARYDKPIANPETELTPVDNGVFDNLGRILASLESIEYLLQDIIKKLEG